MYQPWHERCSLPPYCPYLATSNISPNNKVKANNHGQCSEKNFSPLPVGRYGKSTKQSTQRRHQANEDKSGLEAARVQALGALCSLGYKKKIAAEKRWETHFLPNEENENWIQDYVGREAAGAGKGVEDAEAAVQQEQDDMKHAEIAGLTIREPKKTFEEMMVGIGNILSDLASSDDGEDGEDEADGEAEQSKLSKDDEPGWVMSTITKTVHQGMDSFLQKQMKLDELTQPWWEDAANYILQSDETYGTSYLRLLAVIQPETDDEATAPAATTFGEHMVFLDIVPEISQMLQGTSRPARSQIRLRVVKPQSTTSIAGLEPAVELNLSTLVNAKPVEPESFYPCMESPANYHIDFRFGWRHGDSSCICRGLDRQTVMFDIKSQSKAICIQLLLHITFFMISVTKLCDMIIRLCMWKGQTHQVKVLESKSGSKTANTFDFYLQVTVKWQSTSYSSDKIN